MLSVLINTHVLHGRPGAGVERYFYASSACVYAADKQPTPTSPPLKEDDAYPAMPEDGYGWEKLFSERMCRHFREDFGLGPGSPATTTSTARTAPTTAAARRPRPPSAARSSRPSSPASTRSRSGATASRPAVFMYIDDCVHGTQTSWPATSLDPINLGISELVTINQLVDIVEEIAGVKLRVATTSRAQGVRGRNSDNTLIQKELGWEPYPSRGRTGAHLYVDLRSARGGGRGLMRLQLWSYNYPPEVTGIAPVSEVWAKAMSTLGHEVEVVAAFPHYPEPIWEHPKLPYREVRDGIPVTRLPIWAGRANTAQRIRQELSFTAAQTAAFPALSRPDVMIVVSPSFPALLPAIVNARVRRIPWVLWLHDILPDGAAATGLVDEGRMLRAARRFELLAYREADAIVVLSQAFTRNLEAKGVPADKIELIYDPATRSPRTNGHNGHNGDGAGSRRLPVKLLSMGNIGFSQNLAGIIREFERDPELNPNVRLVITGNGAAAPEAAREVGPTGWSCSASSRASASRMSSTMRRSRSSARSTAARSSTSPRS